MVSRGEDFADSFDTWFFAKTFPTLFPMGSGGLRQGDGSVEDRVGGVQENMHLDSVLTDVQSEEQATYREQVIQYVDGVFTEVGSPARGAMSRGRLCVPN